MKFDAIDIYLTKNPLIKPWTTAYGSDPDIYSVIAKVTSGDHVAWTEACPLYGPTYSPDCSWGCYYVMKHFMAPLLVGKDFETPEEINDTLAVFKGNPFPKSGLENAWWILKSLEENKPLHELFGAEYHKVEIGADFGVQDSFDTLIGLIGGAFDEGFSRVKLKACPGWDIDMLKAVRSTFPTQTFHIDCNSGYTLDDLPLFKEIDKIGLAMIEQPLMNIDVIDHAKLQAQIDTPICLDESINSIYMAEKALELKACKYVNLKPPRMGGISNALKVNKMCKDEGIGCWVGEMIETSIACGVWIELAACDNITYPSDGFPYHMYETDMHGGKIELDGPGYCMPTKKAGNPYVPDEKILKERTLESAHIEAK